MFRKIGKLCKDCVASLCSHFVCSESAKRKGFTLAEILIALAIVGVLAMLVVPAVTTRAQNRGFELSYDAQVKDLLVALQNLPIAENRSSLSDTMMYTTSSNISDYSSTSGEFVKKYMKVAKYCGNSPGSCFANQYTEIKNHDKIAYNMSNVKGACALLKNGASICIKPQQKPNAGEKTYVTGYIDLNGPNGPNMYGRDLRSFMVDAGDGKAYNAEAPESVITIQDIDPDGPNECVGGICDPCEVDPSSCENACTKPGAAANEECCKEKYHPEISGPSDPCCQYRVDAKCNKCSNSTYSAEHPDECGDTCAGHTITGPSDPCCTTEKKKIDSKCCSAEDTSKLCCSTNALTIGCCTAAGENGEIKNKNHKCCSLFKSSLGEDSATYKNYCVEACTPDNSSEECCKNAFSTLNNTAKAACCKKDTVFSANVNTCCSVSTELGATSKCCVARSGQPKAPSGNTFDVCCDPALDGRYSIGGQSGTSENCVKSDCTTEDCCVNRFSKLSTEAKGTCCSSYFSKLGDNQGTCCGSYYTKLNSTNQETCCGSKFTSLNDANKNTCCTSHFDKTGKTNCCKSEGVLISGSNNEKCCNDKKTTSFCCNSATVDGKKISELTDDQVCSNANIKACGTCDCFDNPTKSASCCLKYKDDKNKISNDNFRDQCCSKLEDNDFKSLCCTYDKFKPSGSNPDARCCTVSDTVANPSKVCCDSLYDSASASDKERLKAKEACCKVSNWKKYDEFCKTTPPDDCKPGEVRLGYKVSCTPKESSLRCEASLYKTYGTGEYELKYFDSKLEYAPQSTDVITVSPTSIGKIFGTPVVKLCYYSENIGRETCTENTETISIDQGLEVTESLRTYSLPFPRVQQDPNKPEWEYYYKFDTLPGIYSGDKLKSEFTAQNSGQIVSKGEVCVKINDNTDYCSVNREKINIKYDYKTTETAGITTLKAVNVWAVQDRDLNKEYNPSIKCKLKFSDGSQTAEQSISNQSASIALNNKTIKGFYTNGGRTGEYYGCSVSNGSVSADIYCTVTDAENITHVMATSGGIINGVSVCENNTTSYVPGGRDGLSLIYGPKNEEKFYEKNCCTSVQSNPEKYGITNYANWAAKYAPNCAVCTPELKGLMLDYVMDYDDDNDFPKGWQSCCSMENSEVDFQCCTLDGFRDKYDANNSTIRGFDVADYTGCCNVLFFMADSETYSDDDLATSIAHYHEVQKSGENPYFIVERAANDFMDTNIDECCTYPDAVARGGNDGTYYHKFCCTSMSKKDDEDGCCEYMRDTFVYDYLVHSLEWDARRKFYTDKYTGATVPEAEAEQYAESKFYDQYPLCGSDPIGDCASLNSDSNYTTKVACCNEYFYDKENYISETGVSDVGALENLCCKLAPNDNQRYIYADSQSKTCCPHYKDRNTGKYYYSKNDSGYSQSSVDPANVCVNSCVVEHNPENDPTGFVTHCCKGDGLKNLREQCCQYMDNTSDAYRANCMCTTQEEVDEFKSNPNPKHPCCDAVTKIDSVLTDYGYMDFKPVHKAFGGSGLDYLRNPEYYEKCVPTYKITINKNLIENYPKLKDNYYYANHGASSGSGGAHYNSQVGEEGYYNFIQNRFGYLEKSSYYAAHDYFEALPPSYWTGETWITEPYTIEQIGGPTYYFWDMFEPLIKLWAPVGTRYTYEPPYNSGILYNVDTEGNTFAGSVYIENGGAVGTINKALCCEFRKENEGWYDQVPPSHLYCQGSVFEGCRPTLYKGIFTITPDSYDYSLPFVHGASVPYQNHLSEAAANAFVLSSGDRYLLKDKSILPNYIYRIGILDLFEGDGVYNALANNSYRQNLNSSNSNIYYAFKTMGVCKKNGQLVRCNEQYESSGPYYSPEVQCYAFLGNKPGENAILCITGNEVD